MKRAKLMLTGIALLTIVGAALAFRAKENLKVFCEDPTTHLCTIAVPFITTTDNRDPASDCKTLAGSSTNNWNPTSIPTGACTTPAVQFYNTAD